MLLASLLLAAAPAAACAPSGTADPDRLAAAHRLADPHKLAATYADAIEAINAKHARKPKGSEAELGRQLPSKATKALDKLLEADDDPAVHEALVAAGEAALELDLAADFARIRERLSASKPHAGRLGTALSRPRFLLRGLGVDEAYLTGFSDVLDLILDAYDELYGFAELSKIPGKKLRVRIELVDKIVRPPHFAPQYPYHSEVYFPVPDPSGFASPTPDGKFLFYGLCHEIGHVVAMWGDRTNEEDFHAWGHYTGVVICQHVSEKHADHAALAKVRDVRWRSYDKLREESGSTEPGTDSKAAVTALLIALHDELGTRAIGAAINYLDAKDRRLRINHVRYYTFRELADGFAETLEEKGARKRAAELLG